MGEFESFDVELSAILKDLSDKERPFVTLRDRLQRCSVSDVGQRSGVCVQPGLE